MRGFLALMRVSFLDMLMRTVSFGGKRKKVMTSTVALVSISGMMLLVSGFYAFSLALAFAPEGLNLMLMSQMLLGLLMAVLFMVMGAQGLVFSAKDSDLIFSLPLSSFSVLLARVLALYLEGVLFTLLFGLPACVAYLAFGGSGGVGFVLLFIVGCLFFALIPTLIALVFGFIISALVARLPYKNFFTIVFSIVLFIGLMVGSMQFSFGMENAEINLPEMEAMVAAFFPPVGWLVNCATGAPLQFVWLMFATLLPFLLVVWVFSLFYKRLISSLSSHRLKTNYKLQNLSASGSFGALFKKEAGKFFGTPIYLMNCGIMLILLVAGSIFLAVRKNWLWSYINEYIGLVEGGEALLAFLAPVLLLVLGCCIVMVYTSSVSISLEGNRLWILQEAPLGPAKIFAAKAGFNFALSAGFSALCTLLLSYAFMIPALQAFWVLLVCILLSLFTSVSGVMMNLWFPKMDALNDTAVVKGSASGILQMLLGLVVIAILAGLYAILYRQGFSFAAFAGISCALLAVLSGGAIALLNKQGRKLFAEL